MLEQDDGKDGADERTLAEEWFIDQFGVPFSWALELSKMDSELGRSWKARLETLNSLVPDNEGEKSVPQPS